MRILITILLGLAVISCIGQVQIPIDTTTREISYTEITYVDSISKKELFSRALEWVALNYKSANDVIQMKDFDAGKIIVKGFFKEPLSDGFIHTYDVSVYHMITIDVREGKCKILITDIHYKYWNSLDWIEGDFTALVNDKRGNKKGPWVNFITACDMEIRSTLKSFADFIIKTPSKKESDNW